MYFEDCSPYKYYRKKAFKEVFSVGWLDSVHEYRKTNIMPSHFVDKLGLLIVGSKSCDAHVNQVRGLHPCAVCGSEEVRVSVHGKDVLLGASEIWIPFNGGWFASPSMILHYVQDHQYQPPKGYVDAVESFDLSADYCAQDIYDELCIKEIGS